MTEIRHAVVLAAGRGLRMVPLTKDLPKPMAPFSGSTLIARNIAWLLPRIENVHTVGYRAAQLARHVLELGARSVFNTEGRSNSWWITGTALRHLDEPVFVQTGDNLVDLDFDGLAADYVALGSPPCMVVPVPPGPGLTGDFIFREGSRVTGLSRQRPSDLYCSGIQVLNPAAVRSALTRVREDHDFYDVWDALIERGALTMSSVRPKRWHAVDTARQLEDLHADRGLSA